MGSSSRSFAARVRWSTAWSRLDHCSPSLRATSGCRPSRGRCSRALAPTSTASTRSEEHTSELQSRQYLVCRLLLEKKKKKDREKNETNNLSPNYYERRPWPISIRYSID